MSGELLEPQSSISTADSTVGRLEARHLQKSYGKRLVVKDVSLTVRTGEVVGL